ncbi:MAG: hypothetical protein HQL78_12835 [Magnetococcales bacterium]|nr:hypothetical protein [Magnetococcales bacterium]
MKKKEFYAPMAHGVRWKGETLRERPNQREHTPWSVTTHRDVTLLLVEMDERGHESLIRQR